MQLGRRKSRSFADAKHKCCNFGKHVFGHLSASDFGFEAAVAGSALKEQAARRKQ